MPAYVVNAEDLKARYMRDAIETASPAVRLTMIFDRLVLDLRMADQGFENGDLKQVSDSLIHAQEVLLTLRTTLRADEWEAGPRLAALYDFLHRELVAANMGKDRQRAAGVADMVAKLSGAWHQAAETVAAGPLEVAGGVG
ncbi:MAG TPA: flagellar export chaperone FliS [Acidimicrobiales bacterium]|nr:flagellar export chaperone FliS [Acidimicrobiales bacterium]